MTDKRVPGARERYALSDTPEGCWRKQDDGPEPSGEMLGKNVGSGYLVEDSGVYLCERARRRGMLTP